MGGVVVVELAADDEADDAADDAEEAGEAWEGVLAGGAKEGAIWSWSCMKVMKSFTKLGGGDLNSCVKYSGACTDASSCRIIAAFCFFVLLVVGVVRPSVRCRVCVVVLSCGDRTCLLSCVGERRVPFDFVQNIVENNSEEVASHDIGATPNVVADDPRDPAGACAQEQLHVELLLVRVAVPPGRNPPPAGGGRCR